MAETYDDEDEAIEACEDEEKSPEECIHKETRWALMCWEAAQGEFEDWLQKKGPG